MIEDQNKFKSNILRLDRVISSYVKLINDNGEEGAGPGNPTGILPSLTDAISKLGQNFQGRAPNVTQPSFLPKNNKSDFTSFREFILHFKVFTRSIKKNEDKLYYLKTCVKGAAQVKIKHLDLTAANYNIA